MDARTELIRKMIKEQEPNMKAFAEKIDIPYTTLHSMLERGIGNASVDNVIKVCKGLGITTEELERMANSDSINDIQLNKKDERDIQKELKKMIDGIASNSGYAAFDGNSIDDLDPDDKELLISSLENSLRIAKKLAKQKFTPKKYRKDR
ncbi:helix-turn-helix domain-containing protein [Sporolactobacillus kofuensis]|uniref:Helix-turn-helix domain-containing protein n=1 Tax=Sporolactobacillus kofuensis TaxID=269672 RepID=A0ABW1WGK2_9BACL|nr:helix-turn-helix transcriptional regulator [Sporolactobacillus kofuensis]MCO7176150.1 helix-turn-helix domain-containing protein [Sporolactobacillus kofuensis]